MTLEEFALLVPALTTMSHVERIRHLAWFVATHERRDRFTPADVRRCYAALHIESPANIGSQLASMATKKPPELLRDARGFRLEARVKERLDGKYAQRTATVTVDALLQTLPGKVSDEAERLFLTEAITCFRSRAFRATIVMTWNLAYDCLLGWVLAKHLAEFNAAIPRKFPKRTGTTVAKREDFEDFREFDVIELCGTAGFLPGATKKILNEKLTRRNTAAHPSLVEITQFQAEDVISDLVNNVILKLV